MKGDERIARKNRSGEEKSDESHSLALHKIFTGFTLFSKFLIHSAELTVTHFQCVYVSSL